MEQNFTLKDADRYWNEVESLSKDLPASENMGPGKMALKNILNYSRALSILKTSIAGNVRVVLN